MRLAIAFGLFRGLYLKQVGLLHRIINTTDNEQHSLNQPADMAATTALRQALSQGISSGNLVDTKIILYSYRDSSGRICRPRALYANSHALKTVPYFNNREYTATRDTAYRTSYHRFQSALWKLRGVSAQGLQRGG